LTLLPEILARTELGRKQVISVEDWAEIRRLYRAEGLPIRQIARVKGISRNTVKAALKSERPPRYERRPVGSVADGGRAADQGAAGGVPGDAVDGDRGADRLAAFDPDAERECGRAASGVPAAGSGVADGVCGRGDRAV